MPLRATLETIRTLSTPANEETAKMWILVPILQDLGWQTYDVHWEYSVGRGKGRVDAALKGPRGVAAFIEAKGPGHKLDDHVEQVLNYAFQEGANICALTTGLEWWLYLPAETDYPFHERRFAELRLQKDPVEQLAVDFEAFLGREPLVNGGAVQKAKQVLKARREAEHLDKEVPAIWRGMLTDPDEDLIGLVSKRVYERTNLRPTNKQVISVLMETPASPAKSSSRPPDKPEPKKKKSSQGNAKPYKISLWGQEQSVRSNTDVLRCVIDGLVARNETAFDTITTIGSIARNPDREQSRNYHRAGSTDVYFSIKKRSEHLIEDSYRLLEHFSYPRSDLKVWTGSSKQGKQLTGKPTGMQLAGEYMNIKYWADIMENVAQYIHQNYSNKLGRIASSGGRLLISDNEADVRNPRRIGNSIYFVSTWGGNKIPEFARYLLKYCNHNPNDLEVLFQSR